MRAERKREKMISFRIFSGESEIIDEILTVVPEADREEVEQILFSFSDYSDGSIEVAVSAANDCLLLRIFDGEYLFPYPVALTDKADARAASDEIRIYSVKEEIPLTFIDVPSEELGELCSLFCHAEAEAEDEERDSYTVRIMTEAALLDEIPSAFCGEISLSALSGADKDAYARLANDAETNKYWGYDVSADNPNADGEYFLRTAYEEFARGVALSLAVRQGEKFVGEAVIYAFDMQGGAECAIRLLPEYRGKGIATRALDLLFEIGEKIGLLRLYSTVHNENKASLRLFSEKMKICEQLRDKTRFLTYL